jgi:drug/metabolite transporter (DMT)-like permease
MTTTAFAFVLTGALFHAAWNVLAKRCAGGLLFVWQFGLVSLTFALPLTLWTWHAQQFTLTPAMAVAVAASALVHVLYALALQRGYAAGPFSVVYPVARGSGPLLTVFAAVVLWHEQPSVAGWAGVGSVLAGIFLLARGSARRQDPLPARTLRAGLRWGLITGGLVAGYTVIDAWAVKSLGMAPLLFYPLGLMLRSALLTPFVLSRRDEARAAWRSHRGAIVGVGLLSPAAYMLALLALQQAPLSYVAPVREISMLVGALVGARLLGESLTTSRIAGVLMLLGGVTSIAFA